MHNGKLIIFQLWGYDGIFMNTSCKIIFVSLLNLQVFWLNMNAAGVPAITISTDGTSQELLSLPVGSPLRSGSSQLFDSRSSAFTRCISRTSISITPVGTPAAISVSIPKKIQAQFVADEIDFDFKVGQMVEKIMIAMHAGPQRPEYINDMLGSEMAKISGFRKHVYGSAMQALEQAFNAVSLADETDVFIDNLYDFNKDCSRQKKLIKNAISDILSQHHKGIGNGSSSELLALNDLIEYLESEFFSNPYATRTLFTLLSELRQDAKSREADYKWPLFDDATFWSPLCDAFYFEIDPSQAVLEAPKFVPVHFGPEDDEADE